VIKAAELRAAEQTRPGRAHRLGRFLVATLLAVLGPALAAAGAEAYELRVSTTSDRASSTLLEGATVSSNRYVFVSPDAGPVKVRFWLDDPSRVGTPYSSDDAKPWDFAGTNADGTAKPWDTTTVSNGEHTITAEINQGKGKKPIVNAKFTVSNAPPPPPPPQCSDFADNDQDLRTDFPADPGCTDANDNDETDPPPPAPQCSDSADNDGDGKTDFPADPGCADANDNDETDPPPPPPPGDFALVVSALADRTNPEPLEGKSYVQGTGIYVFTTPESNVTRVRFYLDDPTQSGTPYRVEQANPYDFNGTATDGTAIAFNTRKLTAGTHTITAVVEKTLQVGGGTVVLHGNFTVTPSTSKCTPVACGDILVQLPFELDFSSDHGFLKDRNGVGTGFRYVMEPTNGTGYEPLKLTMDTNAGLLKIATTAGTMSRTVNSQMNAIGVGIDGPNQVSVLRTTVVNVPAGTGNYEQAGLWFGNDEDHYIKLTVQSSPTGDKIQIFQEVAAAQTYELSSPALPNVVGNRVKLTMRANPVDQVVTSYYQIGNDPEKVLGKTAVPGAFFSFDAAGIDPAIGTRTFGGIFTTHRFASRPLTYSFDDFSVTGEPLPPPSSTAGVSFDKVFHTLPNPTSMEWGPDGRLYVSELMGAIHALTLDSSGNVVSDVVSTALGERLTLGLTVGPESTPSNVVLYASHSSPSIDNGVPNSGIVSRLSGASLQTRTDVITGLPRAIANHGTNKIRFGGDGRLYIAQGGNTGAGAPNTAATEFGTMQEQPLSAALLVADINAAGFDGSCNNETDIFGPPPCDVQVFSSGLRNSYDFVFHSNGSIYAPDNGLGVTGTFPPSPTPPCFGFGDPAPWDQGGDNPGEQSDYLNRLLPGVYYGHPNPYRSECVFRDGRYQNVPPLPNYMAPLHDMGSHASANGTIEYTSEAFCGKFKSGLMIARYSVGDDITLLRMSDDGQSVVSSGQLIGDLIDPLPLAMGPNGWIGVGEFGGGRVTILKPVDKGCWSGRAPLPTALLDVGGAALNGKFYVLGGKTSTGPRKEMYVYDPQADSWSTAAPLPLEYAAVENPAVVATDGKLYAFGGSSGPFTGQVKSAAVYDPATDQWTPLPDMGTARGGPAAAVIGTKIYVVGGMGADGASLASVEVFDTTTQTWSTAPDMSIRRDNPAAAGADGKLYVFGGRTRNADGTAVNGTLDTVEMLDPATGTWTPRAPMPTGRRTMAVGRIGGKVQLMGGELSATASGVFDANEEYDPATDTWRKLTAMRTPRHGAAAGTIGGVVYVAGGGPSAGSSFTDVNDAFAFQN
jgi:glucose/arabinose dehydrogenase/N-acetylneuraminic acid mutarotase